MDILDQYELTPVINVSGTMTALGASRVQPEAIKAGAAIQPHFVRIDELHARASRTISRLTGAEAGFLTACSAAGMTVGIAGAMTGSDLANIEQLPDTSGMKDEVVIPGGHLVNYGAPVEQAIRLAGAKVVTVGNGDLSRQYHLEHAISERTAAGLFVVSHHVTGSGHILLEEFIVTCHQYGVPVIVDMASEYDLQGAISLGADLVIISAHKFLGGPTGGIVAGKKELVRAAYLQTRGIGRQMKIGKEGIIGAIACLEAWEKRDHIAIRAQETAIVQKWLQGLSNVPGLQVEIHADWTGNPIDRLKVTVEPDHAGLFAWELADRLASGNPSVQVRDDLIEESVFLLDPCNLKPDSNEDVIVIERIRQIVSNALSRKDGRRISLSQRRRAVFNDILRWPD